MPLKTTPSADDIRNMFKAATNLRDQMILMFYAETGTRCSELLKVKYKDIDFERNTIMIPHLKRGTHKNCPGCGRRGGRATQFCSKCGKDLRQVDAEGIAERTRIIEVSPELIGKIKEFLAGAVPDPEEPLIGRSRQDIYHIIRQLAERAGLGGKVIINPETGRSHFLHPHCFRDALAVDWLENAGDNINKQKALQMHLGHNRFDTTLRYNKLTQSAINKTREEVRDKRGLWDEPKTDPGTSK